MKDTTISARQAGMLCTITILANKIFLLPALIYDGVKSDGFFVMMFLFALELCVLGIFILLKKKFPNNTLNFILEKYLGKVIARIIYLFFMMFFLFKMMLTYSVCYVYLKQQVYQDEFALLALICIIPVVNHAVISGLRVFSRTIELYFYVIMTGVLICLAVGLGNWQGMPILFNSTPSEFFLTSFKHIFSFGDYLFLFLIIDKIHLEKGQVKHLVKYVALGIIMVLTLFIAFYSIYQITAFMHNNALSDIISVSLQFNAIGRLDVLAMLTIMFLCYFEMEIFQFSFSEAFCNVFHKLNRKYSIVVFDVIFLVVYFILVGRYENMILYTEGWLPYFSIFTNFLIPIIILFISLPKRKGVRYEKTF